MAVHRVRIAQDKAELVKALLVDKDTTGSFATYADVIAFAAALGVKRNSKLPLAKATREPAPIALEIFISRGYDWLIQLIALTDTATPQILASEAESQRLLLFEEYANGGLAALQQELVGAVDYTERLLLILNAERFKPRETEDFDLSRFL
jgi:dnd system-associated protein 4